MYISTDDDSYSYSESGTWCATIKETTCDKDLNKDNEKTVYEYDESSGVTVEVTYDCNPFLAGAAAIIIVLIIVVIILCVLGCWCYKKCAKSSPDPMVTHPQQAKTTDPPQMAQPLGQPDPASNPMPQPQYQQPVMQ